MSQKTELGCYFIAEVSEISIDLHRRTIMNQSDDLENGLGLPSLELSCYLLISWLCIFIVVIKGVKSSGKASYFLAIFPYVVLIILLIRAITLEGSWNGIKFFITPDFKKLLEPQVCEDVMSNSKSSLRLFIYFHLFS